MSGNSRAKPPHFGVRLPSLGTFGKGAGDLVNGTLPPPSIHMRVRSHGHVVHTLFLFIGMARIPKHQLDGASKGPNWMPKAPQTATLLCVPTNNVAFVCEGTRARPVRHNLVRRASRSSGEIGSNVIIMIYGVVFPHSQATGTREPPTH